MPMCVGGDKKRFVVIDKMNFFNAHSRSSLFLISKKADLNFLSSFMNHKKFYIFLKGF